MPVVALDVMSGDAGLNVAIAAARRSKIANASWQFTLVGDKARISDALSDIGEAASDWRIEHAAQEVSMREAPARALRRRDTSMRRALELVAQKEAVAAVSAGNTGALMGLGMLVLRPIEGIARPAIASFIPNRNPQHSCCMLDLGANVKCTAAMLRDFALMGSALVQALKNKSHPRVGLLNIGEEEYKGSDVLKEAGQLLANNPSINFIGNIEGYSVYSSGSDSVDVVVCDGFSGNVALKVSEGLAKMISGMLQDTLRETWHAKLCGLLAYPLLSKLRRRFDHRQYNGASFLGLQGVVVKSHGNADEIGFLAAIQTAIEAAKQDLPAIIAKSAAIGGGAAAAKQQAEAADKVEQLLTQAV